jgi:drug/metabolite transporter (DMT)-like permease
MKRALAYAAIYLLWGASFLAIREVVSVCPPFFAAGLRFLLAGILLFGYVLFRRMALPTTQQWKGIVFLGLLFFVGDYGPLFWGEQRVPSGEAAVIAATIPTDVFLLEWLVLRRVRPNWLSMVGAVLGLAGVASLVALSPATNAPQAHGLNFAVDRYSIALVLAAISWSVATCAVHALRCPKRGQ